MGGDDRIEVIDPYDIIGHGEYSGDGHMIVGCEDQGERIDDDFGSTQAFIILTCTMRDVDRVLRSVP